MTHEKSMRLSKDIWKLLRQFPLKEQRSLLLTMLKGVTILWDEEGEEWLRNQIGKIRWHTGPYYGSQKKNTKPIS